MDSFLDSQFYSIDLYVYPCASTTLSNYCSVVVSFEIRKCESSNFLLFQGCFDYSVGITSVGLTEVGSNPSFAVLGS